MECILSREVNENHGCIVADGCNDVWVTAPMLVVGGLKGLEPNHLFTPAGQRWNCEALGGAAGAGEESGRL